MEIYSNTYSNADKEFVEKVLKFFEKNSTNFFTAMDVVKKTKLSRTAVMLSINELVSKNKISKKFENQKNIFKLKEVKNDI